MSQNWSYRPKRGRPRKKAQGKPVAERHIPVAASRAETTRLRMNDAVVMHLEDIFDPIVALALKAAVVKSVQAHGLVHELKAYVGKEQSE